MPPRIAVIGGGISGLAAAHRLTELLPRAEVKLLEASARLGGVLDTARLGEFLVERSADNFLVQPAAVVALCGRLGLADELLPTESSRRRAFVVRGGRLLPVPDGFYLMSPRKLAPLLASPLLSWPGKLRLLAEPLVRRGRGSDESVASFARRRLGRDAYQWLIQPLVAGIYTADSERLSMAATMPQFLEYERQWGSLLCATLCAPWLRFLRFPRSGRVRGQSASSPPTSFEPQSDPARSASGARYSLFVAPRQGMASVVSRLAARLPEGAIALGAPVANLSPEPGAGWQVSCGLNSSEPQSAAGDRQYFDAVVVATPTHAAAQLLAACDPELADQLAAIQYADCAVVSFGFARRQVGHDLDGFGLVVPQVEGRRIIAASFASQKFPGRAPADCVLIRVFVGGALQPELLQRSDADLRQLALDELSALLRITGEPLVSDLARWPASMPQYHVGHVERVAHIERLAARWPGLALAGNAYHGVGIPQCIRSGQAAAERVANSLNARWAAE